MKADKSVSSGSGKADTSGDIESRPSEGTTIPGRVAAKVKYAGADVSDPEEGTREDHTSMPANSGVVYPKK